MENNSEERGFRWLEVDLSDVQFLLRRHFRVLCLAPLIGFVFAFAAAKLMQPVFSATAVCYLRPNFDKEMQLNQSFSKMDDADSLRSFELAMTSDTVILNMVDRLGLRNDPEFLGEEVPQGGFGDAKLLRKIRKRYQTELVPTTRLVELNVEDYSAQRSAEIADVLIDEFLKHLLGDRNFKEAELRSTLLLQTEKALRGALGSESELKEFRSRNPGTLVEQDSALFHERLLDEGAALNRANTERSRLAGTLKALESIDAEKNPVRVFQILSNRNSEYLSDLLGMQAQATSELSALKQLVTPQHQDYKAAVGRLDEVESSLRKYAVEMKASVESEYQAATQKVRELDGALAQLREEFVGFKSASAEFRGLKEEIDRNWNTYTKLQQKVMDLDLDPEVTPTFVTVVSEPIVPDKKAKPRTIIFVAVGTFVGGLIALAFVGWRNRRGLPFTSPQQAARQLEAKSVTCLPVPTGSGSGVDSALFNLLVSVRGARLIQVAGLGSKGGSSLPGLLGRHCAQGGAKTLVLTFAHGLERSSPILADGKLANLSTLNVPAGVLTSDANLTSNLERLLEDFNRIIIDTTDLDEMEARLALAGVADANLLIVGDRPRGEYRRLAELCRANDIREIALAYLEDSGSGGDRRAGRLSEQPPRREVEPAPASPAALPIGLPRTVENDPLVP